MRDRPGKWLGPGACLALLLGCASHVPAPVQDRSNAGRQPESGYREVVAGDTLYSIAWESGRDYRELAAWNRIPYPYVIKPGQKIRLFAPKELPTPPGGSADIRVVRRGDTLYRIATESGVSPGELAAWNNITPPYLLRPGQRLRMAPPPASGADESATDDRPSKMSKPDASIKPSVPATSSPAQEPAPPKTRPATKQTVPRDTGATWGWPTQGAVLTRFGSSKGIDIGGKPGQPIHASGDGRVVYQGSGLRGYGELIIVKHNAEFLSAYAHCRKTYVKEGDVVKKGQRIAEMGSSGTDRPKLHFEIRYRGTPVDPLVYLPK
jgi:lipoprotein NlpD